MTSQQHPLRRAHMKSALPRQALLTQVDRTNTDAPYQRQEPQLLNEAVVSASSAQRPAPSLFQDGEMNEHRSEDVKPADESERKLAQELTRVSEVRYRRLFEAARDGILILDMESARVTDSNPFMTELLGYTRDEFIGKQLADIGLFQDEEAAKAAMDVLKE